MSAGGLREDAVPVRRMESGDFGDFTYEHWYGISTVSSVDESWCSEDSGFRHRAHQTKPDLRSPR